MGGKFGNLDDQALLTCRGILRWPMAKFGERQIVPAPHWQNIAYRQAQKARRLKVIQSRDILPYHRPPPR